ncbi:MULTISPECIES: type II toxin-antitoxin system RelB family antitoxin [unclassified Gemella]|uniref:type II toxin-antitoxin system RelB family antitoxin n=1 Tax=unclassified Gemella TaxID=2624949 RepID=UPI001073815C|nr:MULTISPECIES: DUF6290 family protein [unclassified Gemella]MBF0746454.1 CopG family transcriptional regulator [Gemella sp. 19428wG2_WT2a]MBF0846454.1 CopG family transcriptional regulator [Streptococcus danieliae]TFU60236.1 CopG family transcriptional regulator [Gemella sp. WT2a]MBF0710567.1 CopG family transcriptional regulator [Gemella sp. GL1.1]NYS27911.1 CopG family transcriptional regulator [Gemella sp. GL1]
MGVISIRFTEKEENVIRNFAEFSGKSISELLKDTFFEKLENEYDLKAIEDFEKKEKLGTTEFLNIDDFEKAIGL